MKKPMVLIQLPVNKKAGFWCDFGWFPGEPWKLFKLEILTFDRYADSVLGWFLVIFQLTILKATIEFGLEER